MKVTFGDLYNDKLIFECPLTCSVGNTCGKGLIESRVQIKNDKMLDILVPNDIGEGFEERLCSRCKSKDFIFDKEFILIQEPDDEKEE